jgi:hypothetical protein
MYSHSDHGTFEQGFGQREFGEVVSSASTVVSTLLYFH